MNLDSFFTYLGNPEESPFPFIPISRKTVDYKDILKVSKKLKIEVIDTITSPHSIIRFGGYHADRDLICLNPFSTNEDIRKETFIHELCHATGHPKRLNRYTMKPVANNLNLVKTFRLHEEFIAFLSSFCLCNILNIHYTFFEMIENLYYAHQRYGSLLSFQGTLICVQEEVEKVVDYLLPYFKIKKGDKLCLQ